MSIRRYLYAVLTGCPSFYRGKNLYSDIGHRTVILLVALLLTGLSACQKTPAESPPTAAATVQAPTAAPTATIVDAPASAGEADVAAVATATPAELADILTVVSRAEGLERFAEIVAQVGLTTELSGNGPFTILLPTNDAFAQLPPAVLEDTDLMGTILREHMIEGAYSLDEMTAPATVTTVLGDALSLLVGQTGGTILGANVLGGDYAVSNGMIHIIDTVILPPAIEAEVLARYEPVAGETLEPMQGNIHIGNNETTPIPYLSVPPTSGPHYPNIAPWQVFAADKPWRYEQLIHNLEDSGVVIYYQCADGCPDLLAQLRDLAQPLIDSGRHVLVAPNDPTWTTPNGEHPHEDMGAPIAVAAWRHLLKLDTFDAEQINAFIDAFEGIDHHVQ